MIYEKKRIIKFPIASIFALIVALVQVVKFGLIQYRTYYWGDIAFISWSFYIYNFLMIGIMLLLAVLLFMKKRNGLLTFTLIAHSAERLYSGITFALTAKKFGFFERFYPVINDSGLWFIGICGMYAVQALFFILLAIESRISISPERSEEKKFLEKKWYLPGIVGLLATFAEFVDAIGERNWGNDIMIVRWFAFIPLAFTLSWWLTHPYKKQKTIYSDAYTEQSYSSSREYIYGNEDNNKIQHIFCSGCGRELPTDEDFCAMCGTKRSNLSVANSYNASNGTIQTQHIDL